MENEVKEEVKVETKKKGNGLFTLFACVMTGAIVFLATNIGQKAAKTVDPDTPKKNEVTSNVESNTTSNVESNTTSNTVSTEVDATTKEAISQKLASLLTVGLSESKNYFTAENVNGVYFRELFENNISDNSKLEIMLKQIVNYDYLSIQSLGIYSNKEYKNSLDTTSDNGKVPVIYKKYVDEKYKNVFGTLPTNYMDITGCPFYKYDTKVSAYVPFSTCGVGADTSVGLLVYVDSYSKSNNSIIATAYVGGYTKENSKVEMFYDYVKANAKGETVTKAVDISETNKTKFAKYNFTFEKGTDGLYYYKSVAKAN